MFRKAAGFTLIELLVVIGILSTLMVALLPQILAGQKEADIFADKTNLKWHYNNITIFRNRKLTLPREGGAKFVLAPWVKGVVERTPENRDRYFTPGVVELDPRWNELKDEDPEDIWRDYDDIMADDTSYAGRAAKYYRTMKSDKEALMANVFPDGTINVLLGGGQVRTLYKDGELAQYWDEDDPDFEIDVGEDSPVPVLRKLER